MRMKRGLVVGIAVGTVLLVPNGAAADGGAYIEMDRSHYLVGEQATGVAYVAIPEPRQELLAHGPFYVYLVPSDGWIQEGRPLPGGTIRVGTAEIEPDRRSTFAVRVSFTVPSVVGAYYNLQICNDPCTVAGFREALSAWISIVQTPREAALLNENDRLSRKLWSERREVRRTTKANEELAAELDQSRSEAMTLSSEVERLERALDTATGPATPPAVAASDRPIVEAWALVAIALAVVVGGSAIGLAHVFARRSEPWIVVPDTIAELDDVQRDTEATTTLTRR